MLVMQVALANAGDKGLFESYGMGTKSCGTYVEATDAVAKNSGDDQAVADKFEMINWILGYLTAYNQVAPDTYGILGSTDVPGAELWIYNYCKAHPLVTLPTASTALITALRPARIVHAPK